MKTKYSELPKHILKDFLMDVDGFYCFWPSPNSGSYGAWVLRAIADALDEKNAAWGKHIEEEFSDCVEPDREAVESRTELLPI